MNDYSTSQLSRSNPLLLSTLQQSQSQQQSSQPSGASLSRLPSATGAGSRNVPSGGGSASTSSPLSLPSSFAHPLTLSSSAGVSRPVGLSGLSSLSGASPQLSSAGSSQQQLSSLHSQQQLSSLGSRPVGVGVGVGVGGGASGGGLLGGLSGLSGLSMNGGLFGSGGSGSVGVSGLLSPHSFSPDLNLLLHSSNSSAAVIGGGLSGLKSLSSAQHTSHSQHSSLGASLAGLSALRHLSGASGGLYSQQQSLQQQLDNGSSLMERDSERHNGPRFDMSEFPSLSEVVGGSKDGGLAHSTASHSAGAASGGGSNMASMLSAASSVGGLHTPSEFSMQTEEFPALSATRRPSGGTQGGRGPISSSSFTSPTSSPPSLQQPISMRTQSQPVGHNPSALSGHSAFHGMQPPLSSRGQSLSSKLHPANSAATPSNASSPQASPNVSPSSSVFSSSAASSAPASSASSSSAQSASHFGLPGLLSVIRMTDPDLNTLALGTDLTTLGLNLSSTEVLYATFAYPAAAASPCIAGPADYVLPYCYYMQPPALKTSHLSKFTLETLMYIFYMMPRDTLQVYAAKELYAREWRYHKDTKLWLTRQSAGSGRRQPGTAQGGAQQQETDEYVFFDVAAWESRVFRDTHILQPHKFLTEEELASI